MRTEKMTTTEINTCLCLFYYQVKGILSPLFEELHDKYSVQSIIIFFILNDILLYLC